MPRHHFTKAERDRQVEEACARAVTPDRTMVAYQIDMMSRMAGASDAWREQRALRRAQQNREMLEQQIVERAAAKQPHAFSSGQPPAGEAAGLPLPVPAASYLSQKDAA